MDTIWFDVHYKDKGFDYPIYDPDKTLIFDLIADFEETAIKQNVLIPKIYDLYYKCMKGKTVALKCDADIVKMFEVMEGMQTIKIWLVDTIEPMREFMMYLTFKQKQMEAQLHKEIEDEEMRKLEREALDLDPLVVEVLVVDLESGDTIYVRIYESEPTPTPTATPEPTHIPTPTPEPTHIPTPTPEPTHIPTPTPREAEVHVSETQQSQNYPTSGRFQSQP
ncbi:hypothetical protein vseg_015177 [Gypsophila vaccaria]